MRVRVASERTGLKQAGDQWADEPTEGDPGIDRDRECLVAAQHDDTAVKPIGDPAAGVADRLEGKGSGG